MYERSSMHRSTSYSYPQYPAPASQSPPKHYPTAHSTSSAFSASANPNEDWTKISDLAERRRIQNRIAQRNYRKKLKKRLEDLERRAGSSSASPEQRHEELPQPESRHANRNAVSQRQRSASNEIPRECTPEILAQQYALPPDDRSMFSQQFTRQLSTSPPPFSYASVMGSDPVNYATYPAAASYCSQSGSGVDVPLYPQYLAAVPHQYASHGIPSPQIKHEFYGDDEMSPFSMSYASMAGVDLTAAHSYQDVAAAYEPPALSSSFEHSVAGSPPDSTLCPRTPASMPRTPPLSVYDHY